VHRGGKDLNDELATLQEQLVSLIATAVDACRAVEEAQRGSECIQKDCESLVRQLAGAKADCQSAQWAVEQACNVRLALETQRQELQKQLAKAVSEQDTTRTAAEEAQIGQRLAKRDCNVLVAQLESIKVQDQGLHQDLEATQRPNGQHVSQNAWLQEKLPGSLTLKVEVTQHPHGTVHEPQVHTEPIVCGQAKRGRPPSASCKRAKPEEAKSKGPVREATPDVAAGPQHHSDPLDRTLSPRSLSPIMTQLSSEAKGCNRVPSLPVLLASVTPPVPPMIIQADQSETATQKGAPLPVEVTGIARPQGLSRDGQVTPLPTGQLVPRRPSSAAPPGSFTPTRGGSGGYPIRQPSSSKRLTYTAGGSGCYPVQHPISINRQQSPPQSRGRSVQVAAATAPTPPAGSPPKTATRVVGPPASWRQCPLPQDPRSVRPPLRNSSSGQYSPRQC